MSASYPKELVIVEAGLRILVEAEAKAEVEWVVEEEDEV